MSDEIKIEKGIPMPRKWTRKGSKYPFMEMEIGDSVHIPGTKTYRFSGQFARFKPRKFSTRKEGDGIRVWRIA